MAWAVVTGSDHFGVLAELRLSGGVDLERTDGGAEPGADAEEREMAKAIVAEGRRNAAAVGHR